MSEEIGAWSGKPLVAGECHLCGNQGKGNMGLFLCDAHVSIIVREHGGYLLANQKAAIEKAVEGLDVTGMQPWEVRELVLQAIMEATG